MIYFNLLPMKWLRKALAGGLLLLPLTGFAAEPGIVASIKPLHSLVAGVMQGIGEPLLLVPGGASPHDYNLRPSDARALNQAQVVFWIGPKLESVLVKPLHNAKNKVWAVALLDAPGIITLPLREGGAWEPHQHDHDAVSYTHLDVYKRQVLLGDARQVIGKSGPALTVDFDDLGFSKGWVQGIGRRQQLQRGANRSRAQ